MFANRFSASALCFFASIVMVAANSGELYAQLTDPPDKTKDAAFWAEMAFWDAVKDTRNPAELRAYVTEYPQGRFVRLARTRIEALTAVAVSDQDGGGENDTGTDGQAPRYSVPGQHATGPYGRDGLKPGGTFRDCDICPEMVVVPAGRFQMGTDDGKAAERPPHTVAIAQAIAIGVYELSVDEWGACVRAGGCRQIAPPSVKGNSPLSNLSWNDTQQYVEWLSEKTGQTYRLPTEAEWEYAARAGTAARYWWGNDKSDKRASCPDCGNPWDGEGASPVDSFESNPFGLYDVHGNLWEWTQDCWNAAYDEAPGDGSAWTGGDCLSRVLRGGSWALDHEYMRVTRRNRYDRDVSYYLNGFRVVSEIAAPPAPPEPETDPTFDAAIAQAVDKVFSSAPEPVSAVASESLVIDAVVDALSGAESIATRTLESQMIELVRANHRRFEIKEFIASEAAATPYLVIGTFTGVNKERKPKGVREAFRFCLALLDVESGKIASKTKVFLQAQGVDITPSRFFSDSPAWVADESTQAEVKSARLLTTLISEPGFWS